MMWTPKGKRIVRPSIAECHGLGLGLGFGFGGGASAVPHKPSRICTASGSPGTWLQTRSLTGN